MDLVELAAAGGPGAPGAGGVQAGERVRFGGAEEDSTKRRQRIPKRPAGEG